jgi:hypothetical protein
MSPAAPDSFFAYSVRGELELGRSGRSQRAPGSSPTLAQFRRTETGLRRALSPTFPVVFFIPWRVVAEGAGAAHLDLLGPPGWCSGCWPHDGDVAGGAGFLFRLFGSGRAGARAVRAIAASYGVIANAGPITPHSDGVCGVLSLRHFRWCSLSLGGWSPKALARRSKQ